MKLLFVIQTAVLLLAACASTDPQKTVQIEQSVPQCAAGPDCSAKWAAARAFVQAHTDNGMKIDNAEYMETSDLIPCCKYPYHNNTAWRVSMTANGNNTYKILAAVQGIAKAPGESENLLLQFNQAVRAAVVR